jgi:endo-1,4-beta-xylanase
MEFFFSIVKITGIILILIIILSVIALFFRKFRRIGVSVLGILFVMFAAASLLFFKPRKFERNYLLQKFDTTALNIRPLADSARFFFGSIGDVEMISKPEFTKIVNSVTPEDELKMEGIWKDWEVGNYDFSEGDSIVDFAISKNLRVRGHTLIWGKLSHYFKRPDLDEYLSGFPEENRTGILQEIVDNHISTVLNHYRGRIRTWDVVNEPLEIFGNGELEENVYSRYLGEEYIENAFKLAHRVDPDVKLYLNEVLSNYHDRRAESLLQLVKRMQDKGIPIHGIGLQSHMAFQLPELVNLRKYLKRIESMGLEVELTEVDARLMLFKDAEDPYRAQAEFYGDLLEVCLESPACTGITFWGFTDAHSWMDGSWIFRKPNELYFFDKNMNPKPVIGELYNAFKQYTYEVQ